MEKDMLPVITRIINEYGGDVFKNMQRTNAMLLDLAPGQTRERILVRSFVEVDGYSVLTRGDAYALVEPRLVQMLADTFCMERHAALWVVRLFAVATGLLDESEMDGPAAASQGIFIARRSAQPYLAGQVAMGKTHVAAVSADGTVLADGVNDSFQCDVASWRDIVAVAAGDAHTLGLRADGVVLAAGSNAYDQCDVLQLTGVKAVYAFGHDSMCVMEDGTVVSTGRSKWDLKDFDQIVSLSPYPEGVVGVREDGTLALACYAGEEDMSREKEWLLAQTNVAQIITTYIDGSIALKKDGRLYKSGQPDNYYAQWRDIVGLANLSNGFAMLSADGTVRVLPYYRDKPRIATYADRWENIVAIYGHYKRFIGLTREGNLVTACTDLGWLWNNSAMAVDFVTDWYPIGAIYG